MKSLFLTAIAAVIPLLALSSTAFAQSTRYFLFAETPADFPGGTEDTVYKPLQAAEVVSFSFTAKNTINIGSVTSGGGAGKATFDGMQINFVGEPALVPKLLQKLTLGQHLTRLTLDEVSSAGKITLQLEMHLCMFENLQVVGTQGDRAIYSATIRFGAIKMTTFKFNPDGSTTPAGTASWSIVKNNATTDVD